MTTNSVKSRAYSRNPPSFLSLRITPLGPAHPYPSWVNYHDATREGIHRCLEEKVLDELVNREWPQASRPKENYPRVAARRVFG